MILLAAALWQPPTASAPVNLAYQLDCMADGEGRCSAEAYRELWKRLGWDEQDEAALREWRRDVSERYDKRVESQEARDFAALERLSPAAKRLRPRFEKWWREEAAGSAAAAASAFEEQLRSRRVARKLRQAEAFYGVPAGSTPAAVHVIAHPGGEGSSGELVGRHALIEVKWDDPAENKIPIVAHEVFHYFHSLAPESRQAELRAAFAAAGPRAMAAYNLLNEALATALHARLSKELLSPEDYADRLERRGGFYAEEEVDDVVKGLLGPLEKWLAERRTLWDPGFPKLYLEAARRAPLDQLALHLRQCVTYHAAGLDPARKRLLRSFTTNSVWGGDLEDALERRDYPLVLFVSDAGELDRWTELLGAPSVAAIQERARRGKAFAYGVERKTSYAFVFFGKDAEALQPVIDAFVARKTVFTGAHGG